MAKNRTGLIKWLSQTMVGKVVTKIQQDNLAYQNYESKSLSEKTADLLSENPYESDLSRLERIKRVIFFQEENPYHTASEVNPQDLADFFFRPISEAIKRSENHEKYTPETRRRFLKRITTQTLDHKMDHDIETLLGSRDTEKSQQFYCALAEKFIHNNYVAQIIKFSKIMAEKKLLAPQLHIIDTLQENFGSERFRHNKFTDAIDIISGIIKNADIYRNKELRDSDNPVSKALNFLDHCKAQNLIDNSEYATGYLSILKASFYTTNNLPLNECFSQAAKIKDALPADDIKQAHLLGDIIRSAAIKSYDSMRASDSQETLSKNRDRFLRFVNSFELEDLGSNTHALTKSLRTLFNPDLDKHTQSTGEFYTMQVHDDKSVTVQFSEDSILPKSTFTQHNKVASLYSDLSPESA